MADSLSQMEGPASSTLVVPGDRQAHVAHMLPCMEQPDGKLEVA